ncbi:hypothetical protein D3C78_1394060 [compost metagenome]
MSDSPDAAAEQPGRAGDDEEAQLARWYELEALLAADLARRPKHQTPRLQQAWRDELHQLTAHLGLNEC